MEKQFKWGINELRISVPQLGEHLAFQLNLVRLISDKGFVLKTL